MATYPKLTPVGLQNLAAQLDKDLARVLASGASGTLKQQTQELEVKIKIILLTVAGMDPASSGSWVQLLAPQFKQLTNYFQQALALAPTEVGACLYSDPDGCIQCTQTQCTVLGGTFYPNTPCP